MSSYNLKLIALIAMVIDHIGYVFFPTQLWLRYVGRLAFPIYTFLISEGIVQTKNIKKYIKNLLIFALISEPFFDLCFNQNISFISSTNTIFTLLISVVSIYLFHINTNFLYRAFCLLLGAFICSVISSDYGIYGVGLVYLFYFFRERKSMLLYGTFWVVLRYPNLITVIAEPSILFSGNINKDILFAISSFIPFALIYFYNGLKGKGMKYLFYIFYPLHLFIIYILYHILF